MFAIQLTAAKSPIPGKCYVGVPQPGRADRIDPAWHHDPEDVADVRTWPSKSAAQKWLDAHPLQYRPQVVQFTP